MGISGDYMVYKEEEDPLLLHRLILPPLDPKPCFLTALQDSGQSWQGVWGMPHGSADLQTTPPASSSLGMLLD